MPFISNLSISLEIDGILKNSISINISLGCKILRKFYMNELAKRRKYVLLFILKVKVTYSTTPLLEIKL